MPCQPSFAPRRFARTSLESAITAAIAAAFASADASAANFTITTPTTTAQTLSAGQSGTVNSGASLTVSGSTVAVTVNGNNASLSNQGTIKQTGTGRVVRDNTGVTGLTVTNGLTNNNDALMQSADADVFQMNVANGGVVLNNHGSMISLNASAGGSQAVDFTAITSGANTINNFANGVMKAFEADAVRPGVNGIVFNAGSMLSVTSTGSASDGIDVQSNTGVQITNSGSGSIVGGRHGIAGGALNASATFAAAVTNNGGSITGNNGAGINLDGFNASQLVTIVNNGSIIGNGVSGDGDGVDVDGLVNLNNTGVIRSLNSFSAVAGVPAFSEGVTVGGGTITNSGWIEGLVTAGNTNAFGRGISLSGNDITTGPLAGTREGPYGNAAVNNRGGGLIRGQNDSAIVAEGAASGYTVTINNDAGATVRGGGSTAAAIRTGADATTVNNSGTIDGSSSGKAIQGGAGTTAVNITGGATQVLGDIDGGSGAGNTLIIHPGAGNSFTYSGSISNFSNVEVRSGTTTLSGVSSYAGATQLTGGQLVLNGANRLAAAGALVLGGGALTLANVVGPNAQTFASLRLNGNSSIDLGGSSLTFNGLGTVAGGTSLALFNYVLAASPDYALRFLGNLTGNAAFSALLSGLTINGMAAIYRFDGTYTDVSPVPLPPAALLFAGGLAGFIGLRKRRSAA